MAYRVAHDWGVPAMSTTVVASGDLGLLKWCRSSRSCTSIK